MSVFPFLQTASRTSPNSRTVCSFLNVSNKKMKNVLFKYANKQNKQKKATKENIGFPFVSPVSEASFGGDASLSPVLFFQKVLSWASKKHGTFVSPGMCRFFGQKMLFLRKSFCTNYEKTVCQKERLLGHLELHLATRSRWPGFLNKPPGAVFLALPMVS